MISIVLADDHHVVRQGLRALLEDELDFAVVGEAAEGHETIKCVERLAPDELIVDLMMPGITGLEVARQLKHRSSHTRVILLSMHAGEAYVLEALRNGAMAYVLKDSSANELIQAVREVYAGRRYLSPPLSERAIQTYLQKSQESPSDAYEALTAREREILHLVARGYSASEIAAQLTVSPRTVETHRANVMRKLGFRSQTDLLRYAFRRGILRLDE